MTYKEYTQYKNSSKHIQKMFDNFYIDVATKEYNKIISFITNFKEV